MGEVILRMRWLMVDLGDMHASSVRSSLLDERQIVFFGNGPEIVPLNRLVGALGPQGVEFYLQQFGLVQGLDLHGLGGSEGECSSSRSTNTSTLQGCFEVVQVIVKLVLFPMRSVAPQLQKLSMHCRCLYNRCQERRECIACQKNVHQVFVLLQLDEPTCNRGLCMLSPLKVIRWVAR